MLKCSAKAGLWTVQSVKSNRYSIVSVIVIKHNFYAVGVPNREDQEPNRKCVNWILRLSDPD